MGTVMPLTMAGLDLLSIWADETLLPSYMSLVETFTSFHIVIVVGCWREGGVAVGGEVPLPVVV